MARGRISRDRIEERRRAVKIPTQAALARAAGMPQQTLNSIMRNEPETSPWLVQLANVLRSTPAYLTCLVDDPDADAPTAPQLEPEQRALLDGFAALDRTNRRAFNHIIQELARANDPVAALPGREDLTAMFRSMLGALPPELTWDEQAAKLAEWLPVTLAAVRDARLRNEAASPIAEELALHGDGSRA